MEQENLKTMSLGDHLEELRARMILAFLGILVGFIACLFLGKYLITFMQAPYEKAMHHLAASENPSAEPDASANAVTHLQTIQPAEGFLTYVKISLVFGLLLVSPWVFWQAWAFVSAGLYRHERKYVHVVAPVSAVLFVAGALFFLLGIAPLAMTFFMNFNQSLQLSSNWTFQSYINLVLTLTLVFGLAFQLPLAIVFAEKMGLIRVETLIAYRRYVIVALTIVAAIATPPDVISQIALFIPMYILYEGGIIACKILKKR